MVRHNNQLPNNLPQLQNLIKRDPESYKEEVSSSITCFVNLKTNLWFVNFSSYSSIVISNPP